MNILEQIAAQTRERIEAEKRQTPTEELIRQIVSEELELPAENGHDRPAARAEATAEDLNAVFDFLNSF